MLYVLRFKHDSCFWLMPIQNSMWALHNFETHINIYIHTYMSALDKPCIQYAMFLTYCYYFVPNFCLWLPCLDTFDRCLVRYSVSQCWLQQQENVALAWFLHTKARTATAWGFHTKISVSWWLRPATPVIDIRLVEICTEPEHETGLFVVCHNGSHIHCKTVPEWQLQQWPLANNSCLLCIACNISCAFNKAAFKS